MSTKLRTSVPDDVSAEVMYLHDRTCCVCNERGRSIQIHHIDENPSNHSVDNLAVLCLEHHEQTQIRGGFGKKLRGVDVLKCRAAWLARVSAIRERADNIVALAMAGTVSTVQPAEQEWDEPSRAVIVGYLNALPHLRKAAHTAAKPRWDSGIHSEMVEACYDVIEVFERALSHMASFYPRNHFGDGRPAAFFSALLTSRYSWYRAIYEPRGPGTGGSLVSEIVAGSVMGHAAVMITEMVEGLFYSLDLDPELSGFDMVVWRTAWEVAAESS
jgi:hypothetical protein